MRCLRPIETPGGVVVVYCHRMFGHSESCEGHLMRDGEVLVASGGELRPYRREVETCSKTKGCGLPNGHTTSCQVRRK